jgi:hypothetical protein
VQHIDTAPALARRRHHCRERRFLGDVRGEGHAFRARLPRHRHRFLGGGEVAVDGEHLGPFLDEPHHRGAAVAHAFAR